MDNHISVNWDTITGIYDRMPFFPITLIDTEILDAWCAHPSVWEAPSKQQHSWHVLAMVRFTLPAGYRGQPAIMFGASFVLIPAHQARTSLSYAPSYLKHTKKDCVVLVSMPTMPTFSPQPRRGKYFTLLPISGDPNIDRGPLHLFAATTLLVPSREGCGGDMPVHVKLLPCFRSSKQAKKELIWEPALARGPLWQNVHFIECNASSKIVPGQNGKPLCQELTINLSSQGGKMGYTSTQQGCPLPLTLAVCHPGWDDYLDLNETVTEMANCLMEEDGQPAQMPPKAGTTPK